MHRRSRLIPATRVGTTGLGVALVLVLAGCSSDTVEVTLPAEADGMACQFASASFPGTVSNLEPRLTTPESLSVTAWGDPAIIARCGVPAVPPTAVGCLEVDGVGWIPDTLSDGVRFTSFGTNPAIEVLIPDTYAPESLLLPAFSAAARSLPTNGLACR